MSLQVAEFVGCGHPDKIADFIADRLVEKVLQWDPQGRCAFEVLASYSLIVVAGEIAGNFTIKDLNIHEVIERALLILGYDTERFRFITDIKEQSPDIISTSIENKEGLVSGDQSVCVGYACRETTYLLPYACTLAKEIIDVINKCPWHGKKNDSKCLVITNEGSIEKIFVSVQHDERFSLGEFKKGLEEEINRICRFLGQKDEENLSERLFINTSGKFMIGGLYADTGVTNRKIVADCYGTAAHHGGGGLCGKDLTKVDRLGTYWARWICKNMVAAGTCRSLELELIFSYGAKKPIFNIKNYDSVYTRSKLLYAINSIFPFTFEEIYERFNQPNIKYSEYSYNFPWENLDMVEEVKAWELGLLEAKN